MFFSHPEVSQQPASLSEVGHSHQTYGGHAGGNESPTTIHVNTVDKTGCSKGKLKFNCKLREGDHLNHQFPAIVQVVTVWSETQGYPAPEQPIFSQQPTQTLADQVVKPISSLVQPTLLLESDPYVIEPMSSLVNPTLP